MSVVYQTPRATLHHADARDVLADLATESIPLVIVDPPYGVEFKSGRRAETFDVLHGDGNHEREGIRAIIAEAVRVTGQRRHLYVFGPTDVLEGLPVSTPVSLIWDRGTKSLGNLAIPWGPSHEPITFLVTYHRHPGEAGTEPVPARVRKGTVLRAMRPTGTAVRHPTEKPVELLTELIESSSRAGELVLDPCAGSGSTGVAALIRGRRALLVESDERWLDLAIRRLEEAEKIAERMHEL